MAPWAGPVLKIITGADCVDQRRACCPGTIELHTMRCSEPKKFTCLKNLEDHVIQRSNAFTGAVLASSVLGFILLQGCHVPQKEFRAEIGNTSKWKMVEKCGYEHCYPMVDFLTSNEVTMRLELARDDKRRFFVIQACPTSENKGIELIPSNITARINAGPILTPKVFGSENFRWDLRYLQNQSSLLGIFPVTATPSCYWLFFEKQPITENDRIEVIFTEAITLEGKAIDTPTVEFKKPASSAIK